MPPHLDTSTSAAASGPKFNAVKHGLYAEEVLLPGEDVAGFQRERLELYHLYRPQTKHEARTVDELAEAQWVRQRLRRLQAQCDQQIEPPEADSAGRLCEPNAHQRIHSGLDVAKRRNHVDIAERRALDKLMQQQKLRHQGLVAGARKLPIDCYMDADGVVHGPVLVQDLTPVREVDCQVPKMAEESSASDDGANGENPEQKENGEASGTVAEVIPLPRAVYGEGAGDGVPFAGARATAGTGHVDPDLSMTVLSGGDARPTEREPDRIELPEWMNRPDWADRMASHRQIPLLPTLPSSAAGWVGYSVVGSG